MEKESQKEVPSFDRFDDYIESLIPESVSQLKSDKGHYLLETSNHFFLEIKILAANVIRFRYTYLDPPDDYHSYAINTQSNFSGHPNHAFEENKQAILFKTSHLQYRLDKSNLSAAISTIDNVPVSEDLGSVTVEQSVMRGLNRVRLVKKIQPGELFWGLGDKPGKQQLKGQQLKNWNTDAYGFHDQTDPLYTSVPFYLGLANEQSYGIFLDNSFKSYFHFDEQQEKVLIEAEGGNFCYYFIGGETLNEVAQTYLQLTGSPELPPLWALGYHQCKWSYYPESKVMEIAGKFRELQIPCDSIYLDIDYMDGYRCFTWDLSRFPNLRKMVEKLKLDGFHTVAMIDPGIKLDFNYGVFKEGFEQGYFCRHVDGELMIGHVWPGACVFPDFTDPEVRKWWGELYRELYEEIGISGFWNDMNEPALFRVHHLTFPDTVWHQMEGKGGSHREAHNIYGMQMTRASVEGLKDIRPAKRPFLLSRATFAGGQRYAALWTGDNVANWEHLAIANRQCIRLSISGFSFVGSDIGGFVNPPEPELYLRWIQLGVFHPFFRTHSMGYHTSGQEEVTNEEELIKYDYDQEPWSFGEEITPKVKASIELRYRLLPYLYTLFYQHIRSGTPMLKPLAFNYAKDPVALKREREFLFGDQLLISPVLNPGQREQAVYLPEGEWYSFWNNIRFEGETFKRVSTPLDYIPVLVKAGTVLPLYPVRQSTSEAVTLLTLKAFLAEGRHESIIYEDEGEGYEHLNGHYALRTFLMKKEETRLLIEQQLEGSFQPTYQPCELQLIGITQEIDTCKVDGEFHLIQEKEGHWLLMLPHAFKTLELTFA